MFEQPPGGAQADAAVDQAWWPGHGPRLLFLARPAPGVGDALDRAIAATGQRQAGPGAVSAGALAPVRVQPLCGSRLGARAAAGRGRTFGGARITIVFEQIRTARNRRNSFNVEDRQRGGCAGLDRLVGAINTAVAAEGLPQGRGHLPHVTVSYGFEAGGPASEPVPPVAWQVDAFDLVWGGGRPYHCDTLGCWQLGAHASATQPSLF